MKGTLQKLYWRTGGHSSRSHPFDRQKSYPFDKRLIEKKVRVSHSLYSQPVRIMNKSPKEEMLLSFSCGDQS